LDFQQTAEEKEEYVLYVPSEEKDEKKQDKEQAKPIWQTQTFEKINYNSGHVAAAVTLQKWERKRRARKLFVKLRTVICLVLFTFFRKPT
ncbi:hypothetical protein, partial [Vibrio parahaemolyticus]|uniref:hypothetical protein n=1 Tax=Vibrio parahaemolyticus TaxID=670 RepID=UPI001A8D096F